MKYCINCGTRLDDEARFCSRCGKPCTIGDKQMSAASSDPVRSEQRVPQRSSSSGIGKFFAGTFVGAFLGHLFGSGSHSSSTSHSEPAQEHYHETIVRDADYDNDDDYGYADDGDSYDDDFSDDGGDWDDDSDNYDDSYDDGDYDDD